MRKIFFSAFITIYGSCLSLNAQVGINTTNPDPSAYLDIEGNAGGILPPRLTTEERDNIDHPQTGLMIFNKNELSMQQNVGTPESPKWINFGEKTGNSSPSWFYMPVTPIDVTLNQEYTFDLYKAYYEQHVESTTPTDQTYYPLLIYPKDQLEFIILGYDKDALPSISISSDGILTYTPNPSKISDKTHLNIIFRIKQ